MSQQINLLMFTNTYKLAVRDLMILPVDITDKLHTAYIYMVLFAGVRTLPGTLFALLTLLASSVWHNRISSHCILF